MTLHPDVVDDIDCRESVDPRFEILRLPAAVPTAAAFRRGATSITLDWSSVETVDCRRPTFDVAYGVVLDVGVVSSVGDCPCDTSDRLTLSTALRI